MKVWRRQIYPRDPTTVQEFYDQLIDPRNENLLVHNSTKMTNKKVTDSDGVEHVIMYDADLVRDIFRDARKLFVDGTFQVTPHVAGVYQLVTFMAVCFGHVSLKQTLNLILTIFFTVVNSVMMTKKTLKNRSKLSTQLVYLSKK